MVVTSHGLPHPAPQRIIAAADRKKPASIPLVGTILSAFLPILFLPYTLSKEPRIDRHRGRAVYATTETGLHAVQSSSGAFRDPFASSAKPLRQLPEPLSSAAEPIRYYPEPLDKRCNAHPALSATCLLPLWGTPGSFRNPFAPIKTPNRLY